MSYVDTSVIVAALDQLDPRHQQARALLEKDEYKVISELVIAELASVLSRRHEVLSIITKELGLSPKEAVVAALIYVLKRFGLRYKSIEGYARFPSIGRMHRAVLTATTLAPILGLRTLDLLHVAYAKTLKEDGEPLSRIITADRGFEKARDNLAKLGLELVVI